MKRSVSDLLGGMTPAELDAFRSLPKVELSDDQKNRISRMAVNKVKNSPVGRAEPTPDTSIPQLPDGDSSLYQREPRRFNRRIVAIAACIVLFMGALAGCYAVDEAQYRRAVEFFDLNDLSTEGLDRTQIKRVYRDITTESLSFDKSLEVLAQNSSRIRPQTVEGLNIRIINAVNNASIGSDIGLLYDPFSGAYFEDPRAGVYYDIQTEYGDSQFLYDSQGHSFGYTEYPQTSIEKFTDGKSVWKAKFRDISIRGYLEHDGKVLIYGETAYLYGERPQHSIAALIDDADGTVLWEISLDSDYNSDLVKAAVSSGDGSYTLFSLAHNKMSGGIEAFYGEHDQRSYLGVIRLSADGALIGEPKYQQADDLLSIPRAAALDDGYLLEAFFSEPLYSSKRYTEKLRFLKLGADGTICRALSYGDEEHRYVMSDMLVHEGKVYLSVTVRPVDSKLYADNAWSEDALGEYGMTDYSDEQRDRAREEFSAMLFVLDPDSEEIEQFYTVGGAFAGELGTDADGNLTWNAERILTCGYSPYTNSFSVFGNTRRYVYTLDSAANTLRQERTDLLGSFRTN